MSDEQRQHLEHLERELAPLLIGPSCSLDVQRHCATCADEVRPAMVLSVDDAAGLALVTIGDTSGEVDISLVDQVEPGQVLLIHGGVAIGKV